MYATLLHKLHNVVLVFPILYKSEDYNKPIIGELEKRTTIPCIANLTPPITLYFEMWSVLTVGARRTFMSNNGNLEFYFDFRWDPESLVCLAQIAVGECGTITLA